MNTTKPLETWSPIVCFPQQSMTPSGLLSLDHKDGEVELLSRSSIELRSSSSTDKHVGLQKPSHLIGQNIQWNNRNENLTVTLTTHRIVFQTKSCLSHFFHLSNAENYEPTGGNWTSNRSYKIQIVTPSHGKLILIFRSGNSDRDEFYEKLSKACTRRQWEESSRLEHRKKNSSLRNVTKHKVGVDAIIAKNRKTHERAAQLADEAFASTTGSKSGKASPKEVEVLLQEAGELVSVIRKYVATLEQNEKRQNAKKGEEVDEDGSNDRRELTNMLQDMGMITALSSSQTSSLSAYHETLARQISDFLQTTSKFKKSSGIMTLTDIYCLFNRARGTNMISPEELLESLKLMEGLGLGLKLREFEESGVVVLQECGFDDSVMAKKILEHIKEEEERWNRGAYQTRRHIGVTSIEASRILKISVLLADEQLLSAERKGVLCRDVSIEGIFFFRNLFAE